MRYQGKLQNWNDQKGFGFVTTHGQTDRVFVHISNFLDRSERPKNGSILTYEITKANDGKTKAIHIELAEQRLQNNAPTSKGVALFWSTIGLLLLLGAGTYGYRSFQASEHRSELAKLPAQTLEKPIRSSSIQSSGIYRCDGRTRCDQMHSCAEAVFFINHCPGTTMDGDSDGRPCEDTCGHF